MTRTEGGLLGREIAFFDALREAGVPVALSEVIDATRAMGAIDLLDREALRQAFAATAVKRPNHRPTYDRLFDLWWPAVTGDPSRAGSADGDGEGEGAGGEGDGPADPEALREALRDLLLQGDEDALRRFAREVVTDLGRADASPGRQNWFSYRVLRALSPETLIASLLERLLAGPGARRARRAGRPADRAASGSGSSRRWSRPRCAAGWPRTAASSRSAGRWCSRSPSRSTSCGPAGDDMAELRRQVFPLARRLATRLTARRRLGRSGRLDFRRTVRASLATGGVPLVTHHRPHKPHKPELVVLCDVSGSVAGFAHFTLMLAYALREQFTKVRAFAFIDTVDEVTRFFTPGGGRRRRAGPDVVGGRTWSGSTGTATTATRSRSSRPATPTRSGRARRC